MATQKRPTSSFANLGISSWLVKALSSLAINTPTAIQSKCIPQILEGRNCIGGAKTGSGKTAAFALPILQQLALNPYGIYALILTPTRELAIQIADQFAAFGAAMNIRVCVVIGGLNMLEQSAEISKRPHIVIATPGRLADIIRSNGDDTVGGLRKCRYLVLDEADRLLNPCFAFDLDDCFKLLPTSRQTLLFTATITEPIRELAKQPGKDGKEPPFLHEVNEEGGSLVAVPSTLQQKYLFHATHLREFWLHDLLSLSICEDKSIIIFANRTKTAELLTRMLKNLDFRVTTLHSDLSQPERINSLGRFRAEAAKILVCTDVASRGLDIPNVEFVINFDLPRDPDDYIHRVGRTARAGRVGTSISFITERDTDLVKEIEARVGSKMEALEGCKEARVLENLNLVGKAKREAALSMTDEGFGELKAKRKEKHRQSTAQTKPYDKSNSKSKKRKSRP